jgi:hypothetical protein
MEDLVKKLSFALEKYPQSVEIVAVRDLVLDSARQNERRPAFLKLAVPDELIKNLRGAKQQADVVLMVRIPGEVLERADSRIVLPGEAG